MAERPTRCHRFFRPRSKDWSLYGKAKWLERDRSCREESVIDPMSFQKRWAHGYRLSKNGTLRRFPPCESLSYANSQPVAVQIPSHRNLEDRLSGFQVPPPPYCPSTEERLAWQCRNSSHLRSQRYW